MAYSSPFPQEVCPVRQVAKVTAGLRCPPDTLAVQYTAGQAARQLSVRMCRPRHLA